MTTFQRRRLVLGLVLFALVALVALLFAIPKIQDDRVEAAESQLRAAGITGVVAQFSGRDGTLLGPAAQEEEALAAVTDRDGMRSLEYEATDATTTVRRSPPPPRPSPPAEPPRPRPSRRARPSRSRPTWTDGASP